MQSIYKLLFAFLIATQFTLSQESTVEGSVFDASSRERIPFATIVIYNDSTLLEGVVSSEDGAFQLMVPDNFTHLEISSIGYTSVSFLKADIEWGVPLLVRLEPTLEILDEVVVNGERTSIVQKLDRRIINVGEDIQQAGVNALEAFDQIPEVQIDISNGTVSLRGSENIRILVNGKLSPLNASELLQQIPADQIDRIELITSPSAKERADGLSGIINIILIRNTKGGLNVGIYGGAGSRRYNFGIGGNYGLPSVNLKLNISRSHLETINNQLIRRDFSDGIQEKIFTPYQFDGDVFKINGGIDIYLKNRHEFSLLLDYTDDSHNYFNKSYYFDLSNRDDYEYLRINDHFHFINIFNANYRLKFNKENHFLEFDYHLNSSNNEYPIRDYEEDLPLFTQYLQENFDLQSYAADYSLPVDDNWQLDTGILVNTQKLDSESLLQPVGSPAELRVFEYEEILRGGYGLANLSFNSLSVQAGLRYEYFSSKSLNLTSNFRTDQEYSDLFPSLHISYSLNDNGRVNLGYSRRISRPNFHHINAFQIVSPLFEWEYNPDIRPEYSNNFELSFQSRKEEYGIVLNGFYRLRDDAILWVESSENNRQVFRYENSGKLHSLGLEASLDYEILPVWEAGLTANYYYTKIEQSDLVSWDNNYTSRLQLKNTVDLNDYITLDILYLHQPKRQSAFNYTEARSRLDASLRARLLNGKLSLSLRVVDIFNKNLLIRHSQTPNLAQDTGWDIQLQTRNFLISVNYRLMDHKRQMRNRKTRTYNDTPID